MLFVGSFLAFPSTMAFFYPPWDLPPPSSVVSADMAPNMPEPGVVVAGFCGDFEAEGNESWAGFISSISIACCSAFIA